MSSCVGLAWSDGNDGIAHMDDIDTGMILLIPIIGALLSLVMTMILAFFRVLNQPECDKETAEELARWKEELDKQSNQLADNPELKLEKEKKIAGHILSIAGFIREGAISFLKTEYTYMAGFVLLMLIIVGLATDEWEDTVPSFILGAILSAGCGWFGMRIAVESNIRTAHAASFGLNEALQVAFSSGAVMGLGVTGSGMLGLVIIYGIWEGVQQEDTRYMAGFGFGASAIALFARVGGGIYTKAADVGADLVGKVEADIPEDDPRNPATIADNVGDNVGDVAGMGADLFESFVGSIIASIQLAPMQAMAISGCTVDNPTMPTENDVRALIALPFWIAGFGMICSNLGVFFVRTSKDSSSDEHDIQETLLATIRNAIIFTGLLAAGCALISCGVLLDFDSDLCWELWACNIAGLVAGFLIGQFTEYVTSYSYKPTQTIAKKSKFGPAGVIIQGLGIGMLSTVVPVILVFITILVCDDLANTYGVGIAAVGMLSTLGVTLATDAFGPVADNAGGIAEMAQLPAHVRDRTDALDALGNTTAATGKGFAIGSAVLTSLALLTAYKQDTNIDQIDVSKASVLSAAILGACLPYVFAALTMMAVGRAATMMIGEVRSQFQELNLLGKDPTRKIGTPDYKKCVDISTQASLVEMIIPGTLAICAPLSIGFLLGPEALGGMLVGGITSGFMLAVYMANAGGAWDNAKKWIESDALGPGKGKQSDEHKAAVVGDTIGDPFKDTSGPALNILIKLMTMISLVFGKNVFKDRGEFDEDSPWYVGLIIFLVFMGGAIAFTLYLRSIGYGKIKETKAVEINDEDMKADVGFSV